MPRGGPTDEELDRGAAQRRAVKQGTDEAVDEFRQRIAKYNLPTDINTMMLLEALNTQTEVLIKILERMPQ